MFAHDTRQHLDERRSSNGVSLQFCNRIVFSGKLSSVPHQRLLFSCHYKKFAFSKWQIASCTLRINRKKLSSKSSWDNGMVFLYFPIQSSPHSLFRQFLLSCWYPFWLYLTLFLWYVTISGYWISFYLEGIEYRTLTTISRSWIVAAPYVFKLKHIFYVLFMW